MEWIRAASVRLADLSERRVSDIAGAGFDAVNVCTPIDPQFTAQAVGDSLNQAASWARLHRIKVASVTIEPGDPDLADDDRSKRDAAQRRLHEVFEIAAPLNPSCVVLSPPPVIRIPPNERAASYTDALNGLLETMRPLSLVAERSGMTLAVRAPHQGCLLSPVETRELLDAVHSPWVGVCIDTKELVPVGRVDDWIATLAHRVAAVRFTELDQMAATEPHLRNANVSRCLAIFRPMTGHETDAALTR